MPRVRVRLFAAHREAAGRPTVEVEVPEGACVGDLRRRLAAQLPSVALDGFPALVAVNGEFADDSRIVKRGDSLAIFPPVSGG